MIVRDSLTPRGRDVGPGRARMIHVGYIPVLPIADALPPKLERVTDAGPRGDRWDNATVFPGRDGRPKPDDKAA